MLKKATKEDLQKAIRKLSSNSSKKKLKDFFGKLKSVEDGLTVQKQLRNEWS